MVTESNNPVSLQKINVLELLKAFFGALLSSSRIFQRIDLYLMRLYLPEISVFVECLFLFIYLHQTHMGVYQRGGIYRYYYPSSVVYINRKRKENAIDNVIVSQIEAFINFQMCIYPPSGFSSL